MCESYELETLKKELEQLEKSQQIDDKYFELKNIIRNMEISMKECKEKSSLLDDKNVMNYFDTSFKISSSINTNFFSNANFNNNPKNDSKDVICFVCGEDYISNETDGILECPSCGGFIQMQSDKISYKDTTRETSYYSYNRPSHFNEWLDQIQGKESSRIDSKVIELIVNEMKIERIDSKDLNPINLKRILKKIKLTKCYEHTFSILNQIAGKPSIVFSRKNEFIMKYMFKRIQEPFKEVCPKNRKNFLSYSYVLNKFCGILGLSDEQKKFTLLKSREKLKSTDEIWFKICKILQWKFEKSF